MVGHVAPEAALGARPRSSRKATRSPSTSTGRRSIRRAGRRSPVAGAGPRRRTIGRCDGQVRALVGSASKGRRPAADDGQLTHDDPPTMTFRSAKRPRRRGPWPADIVNETAGRPDLGRRDALVVGGLPGRVASSSRRTAVRWGRLGRPHVLPGLRRLARLNAVRTLDASMGRPPRPSRASPPPARSLHIPASDRRPRASTPPASWVPRIRTRGPPRAPG